MDSKAVIVASCWFSVAIIAAVYMWVFTEEIDQQGKAAYAQTCQLNQT